MRIAFIGQKGIPAFSGGVERHVEEISARLAERGHEVFVYVRNNYTDKKMKKYRGVNLIHLSSISTKNLDTISHTFLATIHAIFQKYDIVHYQSIGPASLSWLYKIFRKNTPLVATFHCQDYYHQKWGFWASNYLRFGEFVTCNIPDKTIVVSKKLQKWAKLSHAATAEMITNGADINEYPGSDKLARWDLKEKRYILYGGRFIKHKGIHYLIEAFKQLENTNKSPNNFKLAIIGDGFHSDDYVKYVKFISEGRKNIIFTGSQYGENLKQLYSNAYIFVQPSETEGLSIALLEAMSHGTAVLTSDIEENIEVINGAGFSFEKGNIEDLKEKLAYLLNNPQLVGKLGILCQERVKNEYGWDEAIRKTERIYNELLHLKKKKLYEREVEI